MARRRVRLEREAIVQAGSPSEIRKRIKECTTAQTRLALRINGLMKAYPKQWVAMGSGRGICRGRSLSQLMAKCEKKGIPREGRAVRYLDTEKRALVL